MTVVSAPGKVLIAGGYLVLEQQFSGLVVAATSRFYTVIETGQRSNRVRVRSPQFINAEWGYDITIPDNGSVQASPIALDGAPLGKNKFVHLAIERTLRVIKELQGVDRLTAGLSQGLNIAILGDNDFYSQRAQLGEGPRNLESLKRLEPFIPLKVSIEKVHKTGMGSSAALITSLVGALLVHFNAVDPTKFSNMEDKGLRLVHNVAQYIHCLAQGKVGSGFDVASAIFGTHVYTRFNSAVIKPLMDDTESSSALLPTLSPDNAQWDYKIGNFRLPPHTRLLLADVEAGSNTPSMARGVLDWRKKNQKEAETLWNSLNSGNMELVDVLGRLVDGFNDNKGAYTEVVRQLVVKAASDVCPLVFFNPKTRSNMKEMGVLSKVDIEPNSQTALLDACIEKHGVIGGGVPGAGGYDAIWILVLDPSQDSSRSSAIDQVEKVWLDWNKDGTSVTPLLAEASNERGLRVEMASEVKGLLEAIAKRDA
ncbi:hypothetical protein M408DRAFT_15505 [Serendipita vermifera MAFF 305830]|uniref:Phosphomevalonate kinase n=1 Tax=Serendipita vermifera MAFF 305830 TaxID=933852 RepID=A0A0C2WWN1_SERVB|nr:hypothetical protein M408DRAFT_15505 [Serendipita vermifera MAFF 305830]